MSEDSESASEEERCLFRPFTRESLAAIEARIAEEYAKQKELEKKRAEGEASIIAQSTVNENNPHVVLRIPLDAQNNFCC
ncbi:hypothetical protein J437_LFUL000844 [Ladona fulva]|uniref:Uncharacterized protein n=1 Tax=Ladona fulva TaxID=123851 RepID=A0A8K0JTM3_LADFU|nr:hypothetical protein J437_LFUL000844 [Ladona fulva]